MARRPRLWQDAIKAQVERLHEPLWWFPFPLIISFALVLLLTAHVFGGTNPRMGNPATVVSFPADLRRDSAIWLSVTPIDGEIVVTTGDRKVFRYPQDIADLEPLKKLRAYLKEAVRREVEGAALGSEAYQHQTSVVIAADQRLKYLHVRPILYALAEAGISQYAFETQLFADAGTAHDAHHGDTHHE